MLKDFREFILRGNLVDLAIAVVIGTAFAAVVAALVKDLVTPLAKALRPRLVALLQAATSDAYCTIEASSRRHLLNVPSPLRRGVLQSCLPGSTLFPCCALQAGSGQRV
jgi:hypothetical protein